MVWYKARVINQVNDHLYLVQLEDGRVFCRNQVHLSTGGALSLSNLRSSSEAYWASTPPSLVGERPRLLPVTFCTLKCTFNCF